MKYVRIGSIVKVGRVFAKVTHPRLYDDLGNPAVELENKKGLVKYVSPESITWNGKQFIYSPAFDKFLEKGE